jgi:esterase/lipase superfamily enzyme
MIVLENGLTFDTRVYIRPFWSVKAKSKNRQPACDAAARSARRTAGARSWGCPAVAEDNRRKQTLISCRLMHREHHRWQSPNLGWEMGIAVYGHFGPPMLAFPTSLGDEWEIEGQGMIGALSPFVEAGRLKIFAVRSVTREGLFNKQAHPFHRSWVLRCYDTYIRQEVIPFIHHQCKGLVPIATMGASLGAFHAANTTFKYPDAVKRCFALSGVYDMRSSMSGMYDDNFYFNNPVDYLPNLSDPWLLGNLASCDIHIVTGNGPYENSGPSYQLSELLRRKAIPHALDDWGPEGGHDWPFWHHQMWTYCSKLY